MPARQSSHAATRLRVSVRPVCHADLAVMVELDARAFGRARPAYFAHRLALLDQAASTSHTIGLVAECSGAVVGLIMGTLTSGEFGFTQVTALIDSLAVAPAQQRRGVGERLVTAFVSEAALLGAGEVYTLVNWNTWDMLKFFDALGFGLATTIPLHRQIS